MPAAAWSALLQAWSSAVGEVTETLLELALGLLGGIPDLVVDTHVILLLRFDM
jgi:hypothetical protein